MTMRRRLAGRDLKRRLERLYAALNRREYVSPDPLQFLYEYDDPADREIVGLVASSLAYGRVAQILRSVQDALNRMGRPRRFVEDSSTAKMAKAFAGFRHRFTTGDEMAAMLSGAALAIKRHGSLGRCFASCLARGDETILPALCGFAKALGSGTSLLPCPDRKSACKRLNLYLRWMVRHDDVDPGGWKGVAPSKLIVPLDTHMYRISKRLGFTRRKSADLATAIEITAAFREIAPDDPVRYDFALTRLGIRSDLLNSFKFQ
jgi:uncharacterized protein (TIGR02757 family)